MRVLRHSAPTGGALGADLLPRGTDGGLRTRTNMGLTQPRDARGSADPSRPTERGACIPHIDPGGTSILEDSDEDPSRGRRPATKLLSQS